MAREQATRRTPTHPHPKELSSVGTRESSIPQINHAPPAIDLSREFISPYIGHMDMQASLTAALKNVSTHGDTDIFPFPFENLTFHDEESKAREILESIHADFDKWLATYPPQTVLSLTQVGYTGFRWATQIDPFWNAYYLALVTSVADQIEQQRLPDTQKTVFSYRFNLQPETAKLFTDSTWLSFRKQCIELSHTHPVVVQTDISDFYPRIYHHRIENALQRLPSAGDTPKRIMSLLSSFSKNVSYGLPIGGPASRILAELALNGTDTLLARKGIKFCRYADDYAIFCKDRSEAYKTLVYLSEKLANEGLVLQKKKTRILGSNEFRETAHALDPAETTSKQASEEQKLLDISIRFDPYSPTAPEDYEQLKEAVRQVDIIGILGREISKTTIDSAISKQAISAVTALDKKQQQGALLMLLDHENLLTLAPVFVPIMRIVRDLYNQFDPSFQEAIDTILCNLLTQSSPLLSVEVNLAYFIQALGGQRTHRKEEILSHLFESTSSPLLRRLIILCMARWKCHYWLSDIKKHYGAMSILEKRAFIIASYALGDEGNHWRKYTKPTWQEPELLIRDWYSQRLQRIPGVPL
jgi:hypothetical protein